LLEIIDHRVVGPLECNCYVVGERSTKEAVVIDPGGNAAEIAESLATEGLQVRAIVATHAHFDHILAAAELRDLTGAPFYLHDEDRVLLDWMQTSGRLLLGVDLPPPPEVDTAAAEGDAIKVGGSELQIIHTPGHSRGSITLIGEGELFAGDTLFAGSIGRSDLPGGDSDTLLSVITHKLFEFDDDTRVHPGHGPSTTIGEERRYNPFVGTSSLWLPPDR
jgi:hydroxyacylglutathione hydrolase